MFIFHAGMEWMLASVVGFVGLMIFLIHMVRGDWTHVLASAAVWIFVFSIHGSSHAAVGIMTATGIALLFDLIGLPILKLVGRL